MAQMSRIALLQPLQSRDGRRGIEQSTRLIDLFHCPRALREPARAILP